jgi:hypothetical protein
VPDQWNGGLVIWNHGYTLTPGAPAPDLGPLYLLQLAEGYAVAASSYQDVGWAIGTTNQDLQELVAAFSANFGQPAYILMYGASLGGLVTVRAVEEAGLGVVLGAMPFCGALAGSRNWDAGLDVRLIYDAICQNVPGAAIPGGAQGLPAGSTLTVNDTVLAINACFGHDLPPGVRTAAQQRRLTRFKRVTQIPQEFINTSLGFFATFGMADLVHNKLGGSIGTGNRNVNYGSSVVNAAIQRVGASAAQRAALKKDYRPTGNVGNTKIVSLHTDKDGLILYENESEYAKMAPPENLTTAIVVEEVPSHCGFSTAELVAGWEAMRGWIAGDPQPTAFALAALCLALEPTFGGPCRIDPFHQIPDMDGRVRPRRPATAVSANSAISSMAPSSPSVAPAPEAAPAAPESAPPPQVQTAPSRSPRTSAAGGFSETAEVDLRERKLERRER